MAGHGCGNDERPVALLLEVRADCFGAVYRADKVDLNNMIPVRSQTVDDTRVGGGTHTASRLTGSNCFAYLASDVFHPMLDLLGNETINLPKVPNDVIDEALDVVVIGNVERSGLDLDTVVADQLLDILVGALLAG